MAFDFRTKYNRPKLVEEVNDGKSKVETAGYVPAEVQIMDMLSAGMRLNEYRKDRFDFAADEVVPDDFVDPTRSPSFDLADATAISRDVDSRLAEAKRLIAEAEENKEKEVVEEKKE